MFAASSDTMPAGIIKLLLKNGADASFTGDYDEPASVLAAKRGHTQAVRLFEARSPSSVTGTRSARDFVTPANVSDRSIPDAVKNSLVLLEKQSSNFIRTAGCNSCHSQDLPSAAAGLAHDRGLTSISKFPQLPARMTPPAEQVTDFTVVNPDAIAWELFDWIRKVSTARRLRQEGRRFTWRGDLSRTSQPRGGWLGNCCLN